MCCGWRKERDLLHAVAWPTAAHAYADALQRLACISHPLLCATQPVASTLAHVGGVGGMELSGDLVATWGYTKRMGQVLPDNMVKVFDCR